jgi:hypothetical protein
MEVRGEPGALLVFGVIVAATSKTRVVHAFGRRPHGVIFSLQAVISLRR